MKEGFIEKNNRKKILLLSDDLRVHSGVAQVAREMVINTCHHYNWVQIAAAIKHPDQGKELDVSEEIGKVAGVKEASVKLYPANGYGSAEMVRHLIQKENPDAIFLITDPRYFTWLFQIENEIRRKIPIVYLNIWDDYPAPAYNREFYESCDALFGISKQTVNINKIVLGDKANNKIIRYVPHGLNNSVFKPLLQDDPILLETKKQIFNNKEYDFVLFFNSRNIRRKSIPDTILAWKVFRDQLPKEQKDKCAFVLHTQPVDDNGTDLPAIVDYFFPEKDKGNIYFSVNKLSSEYMNALYNIADAQILLTSNEGWGLALTEALLTGTPIIANVTGGMQDQMRFVDNEGNWFTPSREIPSNHRGTFKKHGEWAFPVFPSNISLVGSVPTPYIFDDRCSFEDAAEKIMEVYNLDPDERKRRGEVGRQWALSDEAGFTSGRMGERIIEGIDELFNTWQPRKRFEFLRGDDLQPRILEHSLIY